MAKRIVQNSKLKIQDKKKIFLFLFGALIIFLSLTNLALWAKSEIAEEGRAPIKNEIIYWEEIVRETPTYRDGYLKLATLYWQLREDEKAKENLDKAIAIDPNSEKARELKNQLGF